MLMSARETLSRAVLAKGRGVMLAGFISLGLMAGGQALAATNACGEDYYDGLRAYDAGNRDAAIQIWTRSALSGDVRSQNRLGEVYENGDRVIINYVEAHKWFNLASNNSLQVCSGDFGSKEGRLARDHARDARARLEDIMTARSIGDAQTSFVNIYECKGDTHSLFELGRIYQSGTGLLQSSLDACRYFAIAAAKGDQSAKDALDVLNGVLKPDQIDNCQREAAKWQRPGLDVCSAGLTSGSCHGASKVPWQNRQAALRSLGFYHDQLDGSTGPQTRDAVREFQRSLKSEPTGTLTEPQICSLIEQAASNGDGLSQMTLGNMYLQGVGKSKNADSAMTWLEKAAERGIPNAQFLLGRLLVDGTVQRDVYRGCKLLRDADAAGHPGARRLIDRYCD
jgi:TPR repeat protein